MLFQCHICGAEVEFLQWTSDDVADILAGRKKVYCRNCGGGLV